MLNILFILLVQKPSATPNPGSDSSINLSTPFDWIMFVILPIAIVILYFIWKKTKNQ